MKIALRLVFALCCFARIPLAYAQVALSPPIANISLDGPTQTQSFRLMNSSHEPMHIVVTVSNWGMDTNGTIIKVPPTEQSLAPWVQINPTEFTVAAGQSQVVRYAIRPALVLNPGEHRAMVFFTEQHLPGDAPPPPGKVRVNINLGAAIYGHIGAIQESGALESLTANAQAVVFTVRNTGNATTRMRGQFAIWTSDAYPKNDSAINGNQLLDGYKAPKGLVGHGGLPMSAVLPDARRLVTLDLGKQTLPPGTYVLRTLGKLGSTDIGREFRFNVSADRR